MRTFFFLPISFTSKHYPFHHLLKYVSKICDVSGVLPTWTHHTRAFLALQTLCPTLTPDPGPGAEPVKTLAGSKDRDRTWKRRDREKGGLERNARLLPLPPAPRPRLRQLVISLPWVPGPYLPQKVPAVGPGFTLALELVAKCAGTEAVLLLILTDAAAQGGWCAHVLGVLNPVAPKLGQDDQGVRASLLHDLEAEGGSGTAACPGVYRRRGRVPVGCPLTFQPLQGGDPIFEAKSSKMNPSFKPCNTSNFTDPGAPEVQSFGRYLQFKHGKAEVTKGIMERDLRPSSSRVRVLSHMGPGRDHQHHHHQLPQLCPRDRTQS